MERLDGKVALITGGARGLGAVVARRFVEEGAYVALADFRDAEGMDLSGELGDAATYVHLDVTAEASWAEAVRAVVTQRGGLDILVNCAGIIRMGPLAEMRIADYQAVIDVNQTGTFLGMRAAIPAMATGGGGAIVNISSGEGLMGTPGAGAYVASKHAVIGLTKTGGLELAPLGIRVNAVCPGAIEGPMLEELSEAVGAPLLDVVAAITPLRRPARQREVAEMVVFLASDESAYCTGAAYQIDGGLLAGITLGS